MKICAVVILIGLAISFALVAFAQEKEEINPFPFRANFFGCFLRDEHEIVSCRVYSMLFQTHLSPRSVNGGNSISFRSTRTACFAGRMPRPRSWA